MTYEQSENQWWSQWNTCISLKLFGFLVQSQLLNNPFLPAFTITGAAKGTTPLRCQTM